MFKTIVSVLLAMLSIFSNLQGLMNRPKSAITDGIFLRYGSVGCQVMDVFLPEKIDGTADVVLTIHGGSWMYGDQLSFDYYAKQAAQYGYVGVSIDHRKLNNNVRAAGMNEDVLQAVTFLKKYLNEKGIATGKMIVAGHSAGAHLALLYSYTHYQDSPIPIAYVTAASAPCDMTLFAQGSMTASNNYFYLTALTDEEITGFTLETAQAKEAIAKIDPISLVTPEVPPTLLLHGDKDEIVPYECSVRMFNKLKENGVDAGLLTYQNMGHQIDLAPQELCDKRIAHMLNWAEKYMTEAPSIPETTAPDAPGGQNAEP